MCSRAASVAQTPRVDSKIELPTSGSGYREMRERRMRIVYIHTHTHTHTHTRRDWCLWSSCVHEKLLLWMNQRESLREICYFRRGCVLSLPAYTLGVTGSVGRDSQTFSSSVLNKLMCSTINYILLFILSPATVRRATMEHIIFFVEIEIIF